MDVWESCFTSLANTTCKHCRGKPLARESHGIMELIQYHENHPLKIAPKTPRKPHRLTLSDRETIASSQPTLDWQCRGRKRRFLPQNTGSHWTETGETSFRPRRSEVSLGEMVHCRYVGFGGKNVGSAPLRFNLHGDVGSIFGLESGQNKVLSLTKVHQF